MVGAYLALIDVAKRIFYRTAAAPAISRRFGRRHHLRRPAARFSTAVSAGPTPPGCAPTSGAEP